MPHSNQARKRVRQTIKATEQNRSRRSRLRTELKKFYTLCSEKDAAKAAEQLRYTASLLDKAAKTRLIHQNNASRRKSKMTLALNALTKPADAPAVSQSADTAAAAT